MYQEAIDLLVKLARKHNLLSIAIQDNKEIVIARRYLGTKTFDSALELLDYLENEK